jgi:hypothetical protein
MKVARGSGVIVEGFSLFPGNRKGSLEPLILTVRHSVLVQGDRIPLLDFRNLGKEGVFIHYLFATVRQPLFHKETKKRTYAAFDNLQPRLIAQAARFPLVITSVWTIVNTR